MLQNQILTGTCAMKEAIKAKISRKQELHRQCYKKSPIIASINTNEFFPVLNSKSSFKLNLFDYK